MRLTLTAAVVVVLTSALAWRASDARSGSTLPEITGPVILTVSGNITNTTSDEAFEFDLAMLESLGVRTLRTTTNWTSGEVEFEGVLARDVLDAVGARGNEVLAKAANDYVVPLSLEELYRYPVMLALKMDGKYMEVKDKGPIWIVYPRDQFSELRTSLNNKKWVWQLRELRIR